MIFRLYLQGYRPVDIAQKFNLSQNAVSIRVFRIKQQLADLMENRS